MTINPTYGTVKFTEQNAAQFVWGVFVKAYEETIRAECKAEAELQSAKEANQRAKQKYEDEFSSIGFGYHEPYNAAAISHMQSELERKSLEVKEAKYMIDFLRDRFLAGFEVKPTAKQPLDNSPRS